MERAAERRIRSIQLVKPAVGGEAFFDAERGHRFRLDTDGFGVVRIDKNGVEHLYPWAGIFEVVFA